MHGIDITTMQATLSGLKREHANGNCYYNVGGMRIYDLAAQLVNCTNLTYVELTGINYSGGTIDLSNITNKVSLGFFDGTVSKIILPKSINKIRCTSTVFDFSRVDSIDTFWMETTNRNAWCKAIASVEYYGITVGEFYGIYIYLEADYKFSYTEGDIAISNESFGTLLNRLAGAGIGAFTLKTGDGGISSGNLSELDFSTGFSALETIYMEDSYLSNLDFISKCTALRTVTFINCSITDITGLMNLTNITTLNLSTNSITGLYALKNLTALTSLTLTDNCIYDKKMAYTDSEGNVTEYYNLQILYDLNYNNSGALKNLYLSGNYIDDYTLISNLGWTSKDF